MYKKIFILSLLILSIFTSSVSAYTNPGEGWTNYGADKGLGSQVDRGTEIQDVSQETDIRDLAYAWVNFALAFLGIITLILILYNAYKAVILAHDEANLKHTYTVLMYSIIGFVVVLFSYLLVNVLV